MVTSRSAAEKVFEITIRNSICFPRLYVCVFPGWEQIGRSAIQHAATPAAELALCFTAPFMIFVEIRIGVVKEMIFCYPSIVDPSMIILGFR
jgi:hypothetical protein